MGFSAGTLLRGASWLIRESGRGRARRIWRAARALGLARCWSHAQIKFGKSPAAPRTADESAQLLNDCPSKPLISIVVPVYDVRRAWLGRCIRSVTSQHYENWELVLVEDGPVDASTRQAVQQWSQSEPKIHVRFLDQHQGIAEATNAGIAMARGRFIGLLDDDDELAPDALTWIVAAHNRRPDAQWFYSDEDKLSRWGRHHGAYFKPDFSPEMLLSTMFTCHFSVYGTAALRRVGGLRPGFEGAQDHDLALRIAEVVPRHQVVHVPRVLYHWRAVPGSTAAGGSEKPESAEAGRRAVADALDRRGWKGEVAHNPQAGGIFRIHLRSKQKAKVAILVVPGAPEDVHQACLASICTRAGYPRYEIFELPSGSHQAVNDEIKKPGGTKPRIEPATASYGDLSFVNRAAEQTDADFFVILDSRVRIASEAWLDQLVAVAERTADVAGVGTLLTYPDGAIYHAGMILGVGGCAGYAHRGLQKVDPGYFGRLHCLQEFSAISTRFALVRRDAFLKAGGFQKDKARRRCADVDLWARVRARGGRCLYQPSVEGVYTPDRLPAQGKRGIRATGEPVECECGVQHPADPFYNLNLSLSGEPFVGFRAVNVAATLDTSRSSTANAA